MAMWERHTQNACRKGPSFSSSLLDSIYRSIDETRPVATDHRKPPVHHRRNKAEDDVESLRRAIMIEKWIDNHSTTTSSACRSTPRHLPSNSASSTDSSVFSSSETDSSSASKTSPKSKLIKTAKKLDPPPPLSAEGRFSKTKTKALQKIYGDLKKAKSEPISPGGKISSFFNSIFSPRNSKTDDFSSSMRKSRSMKEAATCSLVASRSCLSKNASSRGSKSKRTVRFCPVSVTVDQDKKEEIIKKIDFRVFEGKNPRNHQVKDFYRDEKDLDDMSCASSDLFELENIGRVEYEEQELPLYETTTLQISGKLSW